MGKILLHLVIGFSHHRLFFNLFPILVPAQIYSGYSLKLLPQCLVHRHQSDIQNLFRRHFLFFFDLAGAKLVPLFIRNPIKNWFLIRL